ncbi:hypothetical protein [Geodermatophilus sp. DSM 44513]|uniref:hypothetical protein n=1 Tax=Geodermatophilus sp. DSM 44513 TaxID=1528104 RepID=UPI00126E6AF1|nr:hypothetical protein [Geodermatophilus sp. DSM 44513]WNV76535.1 hypothetical protein RTG05_04500 [Geodermatophilus sp. DSM 44513]
MTLPDRDATRDWVGRTVVDRDGTEIGVCAALLADEATGSPEWMYAERGEVTEVVPLIGATGEGDRVQVTVTRADAEGAPRFGAARELSQDQEAELYRHYRIEYSTVASDSLLPAAGTGIPAPAPATPTPATDAPAAPVQQPAAGGGEQRGRGVAGAVAALAGLAVAVLVAVRLRRGSAWAGRLRRRRTPPPAPAGYRALADAATARAARLAASAGPALEASGRLARERASTGAVVAGRVAGEAARRGTLAATVARAYTDTAVTRLSPVLSTAGQVAWRATRTGTDTAVRATDDALLAIGAALPQLAGGLARAGTTALQALVTLGTVGGAVPEVVAETGERLERGWRRTVRRTSLALGFGVGYVLGARAGRGRYEEIAQAAAGVVARPEVQQALGQVRAVAPAPLQDRIDRLTSRGPGQGAAATVDVGAVDPVVPTSPPARGRGGRTRTDAPLSDPLLPPAKSSDDGPGARP